MTDPKLIEAVARAIYEGRNGAGAVAWAHRSHAHHAPYLADAHAAIRAYEAARRAQALSDLAEIDADLIDMETRAMIAAAKGE